MSKNDTNQNAKNIEEKRVIRDVLHQEILELEEQQKQVEKELAEKRKQMKDICWCDVREPQFEYSICIHCHEHH